MKRFLRFLYCLFLEIPCGLILIAGTITIIVGIYAVIGALSLFLPVTIGYFFGWYWLLLYLPVAILCAWDDSFWIS